MTIIDGIIAVTIGLILAIGIVRVSVLVSPNTHTDEHEEGGI